MSAVRTSVLATALLLGACGKLLGLGDITPDGAPIALAMTAASDAVAQEPLGDIVVEAVDILGNRATTYQGEVRLTLGNNPSAATLMGELTAVAQNGVARFDVVGIDRPGTGYTLIASVVDLPPVTSDPINVAAPRFTPVATGVTGGPIYSLVTLPGQDGGAATLFAAAGDAVYKSVDGAATWKTSSFGGFGQGLLRSVPDAPGVIYLQDRYSSLLKKTVDGGATWHTVRGGNDYHSSLVLDPNNPSVLYAIGFDQVEQSDDGGETWNKRGKVQCASLAVDVITPDTLYCAPFNSGDQLEGIQTSSDGGRSWRAANTGLPIPGSVHFVAATPTGVFTSVGDMTYRSIDRGETWTAVSSFGTALAYAPSMPNRVYLLQNGVAVSNDGGATFGAQVDAGRLDTLAVDPLNPDVVFGAGPRGIVVSRNRGASWAASSSGLVAHAVFSVAMDPNAPGTLFATTGDSTIRTTNGGTSWVTASRRGTRFHFDPTVRSRVYECGEGYFATSTNGGMTFTGGTNPTLTNFICTQLLMAGNRLYATQPFGRILRSTDSGATWTVAMIPGDASIRDVALGDDTGNVVVATTGKDLYRSTDGGTSFTKVAVTIVDNVYELEADPKRPMQLVSVECSGLRISTDGGSRFGTLAGAPCLQQVTATGSALYATYAKASNGEQQTVFLTRSTDGGATWLDVELTGVPQPFDVTSITASEDGQTIYIGSQTGLYKGSFN